MDTFQLLLRIREYVGEETFLDALALMPHPTTTHPPAPPRRALRVEAWGDPATLDADTCARCGQSVFPTTIDEAIEQYGLDRVLACLMRVS